MRARDTGTVVALAGGVGGAKLAEGLQACVGDRLAVVVNTGDDCVRHGLLVMPDHDTVLYNLAGIEQVAWGWGIEGDTHIVMAQLGTYGEETWFSLGDRDLALHIARTAGVRAGERVTEACLAAQAALGIAARILPMTDATVATEVRTADGWLEFQEYFVHQRQAPDVLELRFAGIEAAAPTPEVLAAFDGAAAIILCPSNPLVSVGPILRVPGMRASIAAARARGVHVAAVSPIIGGRALKGPADRMLASLGFESSAVGVARLYADLVDVFVMDTIDADAAPVIEALGLHPLVTDTIMTDDASRAQLAGEVLGVLGALGTI
ncbi:MAG: 2-phospho-L-lactate transferase [Candidatus Limnocylindrales bacterium]